MIINLFNSKSFVALAFITFNNFWDCTSQTAIDIAKKCIPSTVSLILEDKFKQPISLGSGFVIRDGIIVTNLHVIEGAKFGSAFLNGSPIKHKIEGYLAIDKQNDLAIISVPTITANPLKLTVANPEIGEKVYAIGNPKGLTGTISEGIVSGIRDLSSKSLIQITAPISPGSSGGPIINNSGQVIGVAVGTLTSGQNLNFAIPSSILESLISNAITLPTSLNIAKGVTEPKTDKSEVDIREGVIVRDMKYTLKDDGGYCLERLSILNKLPSTIRINNVIFILYDNTGIPVDYVKLDNGYLRIDEINPFLAKTVTFDGYSGMDCYRMRVLSKENGEYLVVRILDFEIIEE
jgi:S1-C subfamily serine protease